MRRLSSSAGFTLIEIMVVVFILGLLATLVAPKIIGRTDDARRTKAAADIRAIEQALQLYKLDNGHYPRDLRELITPGGGGAWNAEGYLDREPVDPWGVAYAYASDGSSYVVKSFGADGTEGGEGKNADISSADL